MLIEQARSGEVTTLLLSGRIDREWAEHLSSALEALLQEGARSLVLDFARVTYVSSAASAVLGRWQEELALLRGQLQLVSVAPAVREMFQVTGWDGVDALPGRISGALKLQQSSWYARSGWHTTAQYQATALDPGASLTCRVHAGEAVTLGAGSFGLGVGAIGDDVAECSGRLGELVAVAGAVACFPCDGARLPDYVVAAPGAAPRAALANGLSCEGGFARLVRFAEGPDAGPVVLSELAAICLDAVGADQAGMVVAAETRGLCGARLRRSPGREPVRFDLPHIREWLTFAPEPGGTVATALLVGVVARSAGPPLAAQLRPLGDDLTGHVHAAVFSYAPLPQRTVDLPALVRSLVAEQHLRDVLHLIRDDRPAGAAPESTLVRGVAWASPIAEVLG